MIHVAILLKSYMYESIEYRESDVFFNFHC